MHKPPSTTGQVGRMPVTLLEVARYAKVSTATVSRFLNGTAKVEQDKREAIENAIAELSFSPNLFARGLKTGRTMTVGVLTQAIESPFYALALKGIEVGLQPTGHSPIIVSGHWDAPTDMASLRVLTSRRVDGLIVLTGSMTDADVYKVAHMLPVVITERTLHGPNLHSIMLDQLQGGILATEHLIRLGHTRIAHIAGDKDRPDARLRYEGYLQAHRAAGITPDPKLYALGDYSYKGGLAAMQRILSTGAPLSAVFCSNDETAFGARLALHERGLQVPQDVSVVGFDDTPASEFMTPPLTTVRQPVFEMGLYATSSLLKMMGYPAQDIELPPLKLVVRGTTRPVKSTT
jgi:LacI family transcriptional regulator